MERARRRQDREFTRSTTTSPLAVPMLLVCLCACGYQSSRLRPSMDAEATAVRQVGCLDVTIQREPDAKAQGPAVRIAFGNRCNTAVRIDLGAIVATVRYRDGRESRMRVYDPNRVIRPGLLDARRTGWEVLEYHAVDVDDGDQVAEELCLDLAPVIDSDRQTGFAIACISLDSTSSVAEDET